MQLSFASTPLALVQRLNWRHVLIFTACLMLIHTLFNYEIIFTSKAWIASHIATLQTPNPATTSPISEIDPSGKPGGGESFSFDDEINSGEGDKSHENGGDKSSGTIAGGVPNDGLPQDEYVAICMAVKDQPLDLPEFFIHHYHHIGIRRFYIMDDGSKPPLSSMPDYGIPSTALTFDYQDPKDFVGNHERQYAIYNRCNDRYGKKHTWMAFLDGDEFLETPGNETLKQILQTFEKNDTIGALGVNWRMHTSSGLLKRPESARKSFITCLWDDEEHNNEKSDNHHIKSIVKTSKYKGPINPHKFYLKDGAETVGENGDIIRHYAFRQPITRKRVSLHHYAVKSKEEYEAKTHRGNAMDQPKTEDFWEKMENLSPHENCTEMTVYDP